MNIQRHDVDTTGLRSNFDGDPDRLRLSLEAGRRCPANLGMLILEATSQALTGTLFEPDSATAAKALLAAAQASAAQFARPHAGHAARPVRLGDGPPLTFDLPAQRYEVCAAYWGAAFVLAALTRQRDLIDLLLGESPAWLREVGSEQSFHLSELWRVLWAGGDVEGHRSFTWLREFAAASDSRSNEDVLAREVFCPVVRVMGALGRSDAAIFAAELAEALRLHKRYRGTPRRRQDRTGWASFPLTALAALAHDRGLRFDVESDYIPRSWVTGDVFRHLAVPTGS